MQQLNFQGKTKEQEAIEFIREHEPEEGYFLGFSGGKDSVVLYDLTVKAGVKFQAYYSATGLEPDVAKFIRHNYPSVKWLRPQYSFFKKMQEWGFPTKWSRWCCDWLKKYPAKHIPLKCRLMGIRAEESYKRAKRKQVEFRIKDKMWILKPIFFWLEYEIWDHIETNSLPICSVYSFTNKSGCCVCPFICGRPKEIALYRSHYPQIYHAFEKAMFKLWDTKEKYRQAEKGYSNSFEEFLSNWYRGK